MTTPHRHSYTRSLLATVPAAIPAMVIGAGLSAPTAQATTFDFGLVYDINTSAQFSAAFGTGTGFTTPGLYEETNTTTKTVVNVGTLGSTTPSLNHPALNTIYVQNSSPSAQLVFTSFGTNPSYIFPGAALSGLVGGTGPGVWQYGQTVGTTTSPTSFTYEVSSSMTQFALNSIGLANLQSCNCGTSVTIEGFLNGLLVATQAFNPTAVGGNGNPPGGTTTNPGVNIFNTTAAGFADVDKIEIIPAGAQVDVNDIAISPVAVPAPRIGHGLIVFLAVGGVIFGSKLLERGKRRRLQFS